MQITNELLSLEKTLNTPHLPKDHPLFQILDPSFVAHGVERKKEIEAKIFWGADRFQLFLMTEQIVRSRLQAIVSNSTHAALFNRWARPESFICTTQSNPK